MSDEQGANRGVPTVAPADPGGDLPESVLDQGAGAIPSLRTNFAARFFADTYLLLTSLVAASVTARVLGPSGRGYYASVVLLSVLFAQLFGVGLGEAAIVLPARGRASYRAAISSTVAVIIPLGVVGGLACVLTGAVALDAATTDEWMALVLAGVLVLLNTCSSTLVWLLISREKLVMVAVITVVSATATMVTLFLLLVVLDLQASGAVLASVVGIVVILAALLWFLPREGISLKPAWDGQYLRSAVRFGMAIQFSNLLVQMAGRLDLIFVYRIAGSASAGMYSVALTLGALVGSVPIAIAYASFPRLPKLDEEESRVLTASLFRAGIAAAVVCSLGLAVLAPIAIPLVFGSAFKGAIAPTLVLLPAGVLWSGQWILCRAAAAREYARPLLVSFGVSFVIMVLLDVALIGPFGISGAAAASFISSTAGFLITVAYLLRAGWAWRSFVPGVADLSVMLGILRRMLASLRGRGGSTEGSPLSAPPPQR